MKNTADKTAVNIEACQKPVRRVNNVAAASAADG